MNSYCGPFALAYVCGITTDEAAERIRAISGQRIVRGVFSRVLVEALRRHSTVTAEVKHPHKRLRTWAKVRQQWRDAETWVVNVTGHYVIYRDGVVYDNNNPKGIPLDASNSANSRVKFAWCVKAQTPARAPIAAPPTAPAIQRPEKRAAAGKPKPTTNEKRALRLARTEAALLRWESKRKRAETAIKKLTIRRRSIARALAAKSVT